MPNDERVFLEDNAHNRTILSRRSPQMSLTKEDLDSAIFIPREYRFDITHPESPRLVLDEIYKPLLEKINTQSNDLNEALESFRAECEARKQLEEKVRQLEELVRSNENLVREADNINSEAEARLPTQEPAEEHKQEEAEPNTEEDKPFPKIYNHILSKIECGEAHTINTHDYNESAKALGKIKTFLDMAYMLFDELVGMCRSNANTVFAKKVSFLMEKLKELTDGNEFLDVNGDYTTSLEQAMPDLCTPPDMTDNLSTEDTWSTEDTGNDEESEHVQTPEPDFGDSMQELDDLCEVEKEIKAFWEKRNEFWENRSLDSANTDEDIQQLQQLHRLVSRKRELVAAMKANRLANKQEWFRRMFGLDRNPTNEEINTETQNRLGEPYNGDEGQLHRLVDARIRDQFKDQLNLITNICTEFGQPERAEEMQRKLLDEHLHEQYQELLLDDMNRQDRVFRQVNASTAPS